MAGALPATCGCGRKRLLEAYICECELPDGCNHARPITIPPDPYFMMGDDRGALDDSRLWGPVPSQRVVDRALDTDSPASRAARR